jgi:pyruvate formate lyase activating enzyme
MRYSQGSDIAVIEKMITRVYHIYYTPATKEVSLMFWGCNIECRGCYCKRRIYSPMLKDFIGANVLDDPGIAKPPELFLHFDEIFQHLDQIAIERVLLEGQEASVDPLYPELTEALHKRYKSQNVLLTNLYEMPDLKHTDKVVVGLKAVTDSIHEKYTGVSNKGILKNIKYLYDSGVKLVVESVFIPGYIGIGESEKISRFIAGLDENIPYVLLPYFKAGNNPWRRPTPGEMGKAADAARKHLANVYFFRGDEQMKYDVTSIFPRGLGETPSKG